MDTTRIRDRLVLFIRQYSRENGYAPTVREMAEHIGRSTSVTKTHLDRLITSGRISHVPRTTRTWRVIE